jgi:SAM-dependent methyltransferase
MLRDMLYDPWLDLWIPKFPECSAIAPVLEIGCGTGADTSTLVRAGLSVVAFDVSAASVATTRVRVPQARVYCQDIRAPFPLREGEAGAVVASLTLHYFPWQETVDILRRVREVLPIGGLFFCRLNSTQDQNFGAVGHPAIEPNYYLVAGQPKRFFDEESVDALFASGWQVVSKEHQTTQKYLRKKALWEIVARRDA